MEEQDLVFEEHRKTYAIGQIALWSAISSTEISLEDLKDYKKCDLYSGAGAFVLMRCSKHHEQYNTF